ncbi:MAG: 2,3-bisphosphoglycerate-independent phosphoglycerate mutase [Gammaproteobacteria bacterium]|nr:2,3-bisphosphoglycerate-independent phosphoglycerate mutase [Gammaproteobacteria bacterium]
MAHRPMVLIVLDGWGYSENTNYNAIHSARKPVWDRLWSECPHGLISASGLDVGLPDQQMGNSEVGHMNIGSGRVVHQEFTRISRAVEDGSFFRNETFTGAFRAAAANGKALHLLGLLSPGGVHSHQDHIYALLELAARCEVRDVHLHAFLDGRDTPPKSAAEYLHLAQIKMREVGCGRFASIVGRYFAMDRNNHWDRTQKAYDLISSGTAAHVCSDAFIAVDLAYARGETDEFVAPTAIVRRGGKPVRVEDGDVMVFANYRADRARQLARAFTWPAFDNFPRAHVPKLAAFIGMTQYKAEYDFPVAFPPVQLRNSFGEFISRLGLHQLRVAETEKYAHVTFFFNGGEEYVFRFEDRILVPSPHVATYDLKPEMSAVEVTDRMVEAIRGGNYDAIICNFANADMVGHSGDFNATVRAIEAIDGCLGRIVDAARAAGGEVLITSDHGNAEQMRSFGTEKEQSQPHTAHTSNLVPLVYVGRSADIVPGVGALCDIAPTLLHLMGLEQPAEMTGKSRLRLRAPAARDPQGTESVGLRTAAGA